MTFWYWFTHWFYLSRWELMNVPIWYEIVAALMILGMLIIIVFLGLGIYWLSLWNKRRKYIKNRLKESEEN